jgi:CHAT domain-containing protein
MNAAPSAAEDGRRAFERGAFSEAIARWRTAMETSSKRGDVDAEVEARVNLAEAHQAIGQHRRAVQILEQAVLRSDRSENRSVKAIARSKLGAALTMTLQLDRAGTLLDEALELARAEAKPELTAAILTDRGNLMAAKQMPAEALAAFEESASLARKSDNHTLAAQALSNAAAAAGRAGMEEKSESLNGEAIQEVERLPSSHSKAFLLLTAAQTDRAQPTNATTGAVNRRLVRAQQTLQSAQKVAAEAGDRWASTYAWGNLGNLYERDRQFDTALSLTRRAAFDAQQAQLPEALYRWEWQTGRILKARGEADEAIGAYRRAIQTLQPIRHDLSLGYGNAFTHPSFRETDGPLYFQLADLLLQQAKAETNAAKAQRLLVEARDTVEQLKTVELEDYFQDDCVNVARSRTRVLDEAVDQHTAIIYLIPLENRTELLVSVASGMRRFTLDVGNEALTREVRSFRRNLETRTTYGYLAEGQQLYDWLIRPIHGLLDEHAVKTLVFVPDGALRTIPLGSLHDGKQFLIQEYALAVAPGLSLVEPHPIRREKVRLLLNGLSKPVQDFPALDFVPGELGEIGPMYRSETLLNEGFVTKTISDKLTQEQYSIVHIASHGQFDRDVRKTFVLTFDGRLTLNDLEALIRPSQYRGRPVELLVLSACQTAAGDDRAALGLAGVAVKAGARSALATLWFVNDQSTSTLVGEFYQQLRQAPGVSKAQALQAAQIKLISDRRYRHPCYWSPYLIIGNWL